MAVKPPTKERKVIKMSIDIKFTPQEVIDMGSDLYDNKGFTRETIRLWLQALIDNGYTDVDFERVYDLIVG